jgi:hypothetical protein
VDALAVKTEEELLPILSRFHNIAAASGKKLMFTKGAFSNLKWNDESLHFAMEHIDLSRVDQKLILETAVLKAGSATLTMIATQGWITKADKIEKLIKLAQDNNRTEALSWLPDYKNRTVDIAAETVKAEAKMKQQLAENPNSLAAMKKYGNSQNRKTERSESMVIKARIQMYSFLRRLEQILLWPFLNMLFHLMPAILEMRKSEKSLRVFKFRWV